MKNIQYVPEIETLQKRKCPIGSHFRSKDIYLMNEKYAIRQVNII